MAVSSGDVTRLLQSWRAGDPSAAEGLLAIVYNELHRIAERHLVRERAHHTLRPTDLVAEAYLRLVEGAQPDWQDRVQFFAIAANTMRRVLIDHARKQRAEKRGGGISAVPFDDQVGGEPRPFDLVALDEALQELGEQDPRKVRALELSYFGGLSHDEVAQILGIHVNTVARDLTFAKAWLRRRLQDSPNL
jgi:RNA polymerase sigma factor (TIGR02999 family)